VLLAIQTGNAYYLITHEKTTPTGVNNSMKVIQDPLKTTVKGLTDANVRVACSRIQDKIVMYGICSDKEQAYLDKYAKKNSLQTV
jgi:hypothetical protein